MVAGLTILKWANRANIGKKITNREGSLNIGKKISEWTENFDIGKRITEWTESFDIGKNISEWLNGLGSGREDKSKSEQDTASSERDRGREDQSKSSKNDESSSSTRGRKEPKEDGEETRRTNPRTTTAHNTKIRDLSHKLILLRVFRDNIRLLIEDITNLLCATFIISNGGYRLRATLILAQL